MSRTDDVHLLYNNREVALIKSIDEALRARGIVPWFWDRARPNDWKTEEIASIISTPVSAVFLGKSGWGPFHLEFSRKAYESGRPIIPVLLPGWNQRDPTEIERDLDELDGLFRRVRRTEFQTPDHAEALRDLAQRIVDAPYQPVNSRNTTRKGDSNSGEGRPVARRLMVYVPARSQKTAHWRSLRHRLEQEPGLRDCVWYGHDYTATTWSPDGIAEFALELEATITARVLAANQSEPPRPITHITLMGHSFGGLLVRMAYLMAAGQYREKQAHSSDWLGLVDRIVLFAAPNRGIEAKRLPWRERTAIYWPFPGKGQLVRDQLVGSAAITDLRVRWIRFFATLEPTRRPTVVQLRGRGDRVVKRDDSLDIEQFPDAWQMDIPGATHLDIHDVPEGNDDRYELLRQGILAARPVDPSTRDQSPRRHPVIIIAHGMRANNETWAEQLQALIRQRAPNAMAIAPTYAYFPLLDFAIPWLRAKKIRWLQDQYSTLLAQHPRARFCFVGHSNATYLLGHSLERVPGMVFDRITLVSSVLPRKYDWTTRFQRGQVRRVSNHRAAGDIPVAILCNLLRALGTRDVGTSGFDGFDERPEEIEEVYYYEGGHSRALEQGNLAHLADYTLSGRSDFPLARKETKPWRLLSRLSSSTFVGLAVAAAVLSVFVIAVWLVAELLIGILPWPPLWVGVLSAALVTIVVYLFGRYF